MPFETCAQSMVPSSTYAQQTRIVSRCAWLSVVALFPRHTTIHMEKCTR